MSLSAAANLPYPSDDVPDCVRQLGWSEPDSIADRFAESLEDDPFDIIGFAALGSACYGHEFIDLINWLTEDTHRHDDAFVVGPVPYLPVVGVVR